MDMSRYSSRWNLKLLSGGFPGHSKGPEDISQMPEVQVGTSQRYPSLLLYNGKRAVKSPRKGPLILDIEEEWVFCDESPN